MSDVYTLSVRNFRSIREATVELAPLTVIYGPSGSGKSSLLYGLLTLRNFLHNSNQNIAAFFSYPSISLGGLQEVVHNCRADESMSFAIGVRNQDAISTQFTLTLGEPGGMTRIDLPLFPSQDPSLDGGLSQKQNLELAIALPYGGNQQVDHVIKAYQYEKQVYSVKVIWNGIAVTAQVPQQVVTSDQNDMDVVRMVNDMIPKFLQCANHPILLAQQTGFVPTRRGFSKATYGMSSVTSALATEDEVASLLATHSERRIRYTVSKYLERIAQRRVNASNIMGTSAFTIDAVPTDEGVPVSIVNDGFGINQMLYLLTVCLYPTYKIVAIEEPEIHLHPSLVRELARAMVDIVAQHDRRLIISTHSEGFVLAVLAQIATGKLSVDDVSFILTENSDGQSIFTKQEATPHGQIQGGLEAFMAAELKDFATLLGVDN